MSVVRLTPIHTMVVGEVSPVSVEMMDKLEDGETISTATTTSITPTGELTMGAWSVGGAGQTIRSRAIPTGQWVQATADASSAVAGKEYDVLITFTTSESQTLKRIARIAVEAAS